MPVCKRPRYRGSPIVLMAVLLDPLWLAYLLGLPEVPLVRLFGSMAAGLDSASAPW